MMKVVVIFACLLVLVAADSVCVFQQYIKFMDSTVDMCADKLKMGKEIVEEAKAQRKSKKVDTVGCVKACMLKNFNMIKNGKVYVPANFDVIETIYPDQPYVVTKLKDLMVKCANTVKDMTNECEIALHYENCCIVGLEYIF